MKTTPEEKELARQAYRALCEADVKWYLSHGRFGTQRVRTDRDGVEYVIGDWSWHRAEAPICSHCCQPIVRRESVDTLLPSAMSQ